MSTYLVILLAGAATAAAFGVVDVYAEPVNSNNNQTTSDQVRAALKDYFSPIPRLATDPRDDSYIFNTTQNGQTETCQGHYQPQANSVKLVGKIACTTDAVVNIQK